MTVFDAALKDLYTEQRVRNLVYRSSPLLAILPKNTNWGGRRQPIPVQSGVVKGASTLFGVAQTNANPGNYDAFYVDSVNDYATATISGKVMRASRDDVMSFLRAAKVEVDGALRILSRRLSHRIFGDGTGWIGRISVITNAAPSVITLGPSATETDPDSVVHFERGMVISACAADGTDRTSGAIAGGTSGGVTYGAGDKIVSIDRDLGKLTMTSDLVGDWAAGDYLFVQGDRASTSAVPVTGTRSVIAGLAAWFPSSAPGGSDSFFGLNRSVDTTRLAGVRFDASSLSLTVEEILIKACWRLHREGGKPSHCVMNPAKLADLIISQGDKARYETIPSPDAPSIGVRAMILLTPSSGEIRILADENCPVNRAYLLSMESLKLCSMGECPGFLEHDGMRLLRVSNSDSVEVRAGYYANMTCDSPRDNAVILFA